jgi:hypothetical protein
VSEKRRFSYGHERVERETVEEDMSVEPVGCEE